MNRNINQLKSLTEYCEEHPEERFWQALRNWSGYGFVLVSNTLDPTAIPGVCIDTFYWED